MIADAGAYAAATVLLGTGAGHLRSPTTLPAALAAHGLLPAPAAVAVLVTAAEVGLGASVALALLRADAGGLRVALAGSAVLFGLLALYAWRVVAGGRGGPCGCSRTPLPMTGWVAARAGGLAALALAGAAWADPAPAARPATELAVVLLAAATLACLLWQLPAAMLDPATSGGTR